MEFNGKKIKISEFIVGVITITIFLLGSIGFIIEPSLLLDPDTILSLIVGAILATITYHDAKKRRYDHVWLFVLVSFTFLILGYIVYMILRPDMPNSSKE